MIKKSVSKELGSIVYLQALEIFLLNAEKNFILFNLYVESQDYINAKSICHKLIGSCEAIGVKKLPNLLREADENLAKRYVRKENLLQINNLFNDLKTFIKTNFELEIDQ